MSFWKKLSTLALVLCLLLLVSGCWAQYRQTQLASQLIRLHVVANSDTEADQHLKLQVRDAVLAQCQQLLQEANSVSNARETLSNQMDVLAQAGSQTVQAAGYSYPVSVSLEYTQFPTIDYGDFALPAGDYQALRVVIGSGEGHNWWCVLFPALCLSPVSELSETAMAEGLTEEDIALITQKGTDYELRFRCIELWEELIARLKQPKG